jgi:hypothetical protein
MGYGASANNSIGTTECGTGTEKAPSGLIRLFGNNPVHDRRD